MTQHVLLLRGINVSGANIVKMSELRAMLTGLGYGGVETYIQSGNAVFSSSNSGSNLASEIAAAFFPRFGFAPQMMLLTANELTSAVAGNPFGEAGIDPARLHVGFLAGEASDGAVAMLASKPRTSEEYQIKGRVFYLFTPDGLGKSKFAASIERSLKVPITFRNWRTVSILAEMVVNPKPQ